MKTQSIYHYLIVVLLTGLVAMLAAPTQATTTKTAYSLTAALRGAQQVPPNSSLASGAGRTSCDPATASLGVFVTLNGIAAANLTGAHIHLGATGTSGGILVDLGTSAWTSTSSGGIALSTTVTFPKANEADLLNGNTYINVHTKTYCAGEIRGQLIVNASLVGLSSSYLTAASANGAS